MTFHELFILPVAASSLQSMAQGGFTKGAAESQTHPQASLREVQSGNNYNLSCRTLHIDKFDNVVECLIGGEGCETAQLSHNS